MLFSNDSKVQFTHWKLFQKLRIRVGLLHKLWNPSSICIWKLIIKPFKYGSRMMHKNSTALTFVPQYNNMYQSTTDKLFYIDQYWSIAFRGKKYLCIIKKGPGSRIPDPRSRIIRLSPRGPQDGPKRAWGPNNIW